MAVTDSIQFVFEEQKIDRIHNRLTPLAFTPIPSGGRLALSTCTDHNLTDAATWAMGERLRSIREGFRQQRKPAAPPVVLLGRADMKAEAYASRGLDFHPKPLNNLPEHVDIIGWEQVAPSPAQREQMALDLSLLSAFIPA